MKTYFTRGALTSKPYSFVARPWEFKSIESIDFFDSIGSSLRFDIRGDSIIRALPLHNEDLNEEWISDKARFSIDGFRLQRIDTPLLLLNNKYISLTWSNSIHFLSNLVLNKKLSFLSTFFNLGQLKSDITNFNYFGGSFSDIDNEIWLNLFSTTFFYKKNSIFTNKNLAFRDNFIFNFRIKEIIKYKIISLVGINVRYDSPVLNIRIRQHVLKRGLIVSSFGFNFLSTFSILFLGSINSFNKLVFGSNWFFSKLIKNQSMILFNSDFLKKMPFSSLRERFNSVNIKINFLFKTLSSVSMAEINNFYASTNLDKITALNLFNSLPSLRDLRLNNSLLSSRREQTVVSLSHHGDFRLSFVDFILPISAPFEHEGLLLNNEGLQQQSRFVLSSPKNVLNLKESIILLFTLLLRKNINFFQISTILATFYSNLIAGINNSGLWGFVYKFFDLNKSKLSFSLLLKEIFSMVFFVNNKPEILEKFSISDMNITLLSGAKLINKTTSPLFNSIDSYYIQDEISSSSFSLVSANERLSIKTTYS